MAFGTIRQLNSEYDIASQITVTLSLTPTSGNLLCAVCDSRAESQETPSGWTLAISDYHAIMDDNLSIFYKIAGSGESRNITFRDGQSNQWLQAAVYEVEGPWGSSPLDKTNAQDSGEDHVETISTGSTGTLSSSQEWAIVGVGIRDWYGNGSFTPGSIGSGWIAGEYFAEPLYGWNCNYFVSAYRTVSSTAALECTTTWTVDNPGPARAAIATFRNTSSSPPAVYQSVLRPGIQPGVRYGVSL